LKNVQNEKKSDLNMFRVEKINEKRKKGQSEQEKRKTRKQKRKKKRPKGTYSGPA
jgi:hypothetical protein